jgi:flagellar hook protein FlgE
MMRSLFSGVSGLKSHQTRMDVIGNNIANVNTTGFKSSRVTFVDTLAQTLSGASAPTDTTGGTNPKQIGLGTGIGSIDTLFTNGSVQSTGNNTDLCLSGSGLFVVKDTTGTYYTRNGAFLTDADGNLVTSSGGLFVQGWMASGTGDSRTISSTGSTTNITGLLAGKPIAASATTKITINNNLSSATATAGTAVTTANVYDSEGNEHIITLTYTKTAANTWSVTAASSDSTCTPTLGTTTIKFTSDGAYDSSNSTIGTLSLALTNGATTPQTVTLSPSSTAFTQYSGESTVTSSADGYTDGTLKSISIDSKGIITGTYTNGVNQEEAQIAIASFNNPSGLTKSGSSLYSMSNNSGDPNVKTATALGCTLTPSALEMSNVDLANEFSDMIVTQRGFQSNSKIITVADEMLETLVNMKR